MIVHYKTDKTLSNWRQVMKFPDTELCSTIKLGSFVLPMYKEMFDKAAEMFPWMPSKCPVKPGKFYVMNHSQYQPEVKLTDVVNTKSSSNFQYYPNGIYRPTVKLFTKDDPFVFVVQWQIEVKERLGEEEF